MSLEREGATTGASEEQTTFALYGAGAPMCDEKGMRVQDAMKNGQRVGSYDEIIAGKDGQDIVISIPVIDDRELDRSTE